MEAKITGTRYVLAVQNLTKSVDYYKNKMGFTTDWFDGDNWHCLSRGSFTVMLGHCADDRSAFETRNHSYFAYITAENVDELFHEFRNNGCEIFMPPQDKPWGMREFGLRTIDGHRMMFGQPIPRLHG